MTPPNTYRLAINFGIPNLVGYAGGPLAPSRVVVDFISSGALITTLVSGQATVVPESQGINDNFDTNVLNTNRWALLVPPPTSTVTVTNTNQRLEVAMGPGAGGGGIFSRCSVSGDFDVQVDYILLNWPSNNHHSVRLGATDFNAPVLVAGMNRGSFSSELYVLDIPGNSLQTIPTSHTSGRLRLVRTGPTLSGFFFSGTGWVQLGSGAVSTVPIRFHLDLGTSDSNAPGGILIAFDNFQVNAGTISCPCSSSPSFAEVVQNSVTVETIPNSPQIIGDFRPNCGLTLKKAAQIGGYDHLNWLQVVTEDTILSDCLTALAFSLNTTSCLFVTGLANSSDSLPTIPYIDPAHGLSDAVIDGHLLGWNGSRITIPIFDRNAHFAFFKLAKDPEDKTDSPKMLATPGAHVELYGWEEVLAKPEQIIICEGEFDRLVLESQGFAAVTSTGGAATFRREWAEAFREIPTIYMCFDNDGRNDNLSKLIEGPGRPNCLEPGIGN